MCVLIIHVHVCSVFAPAPVLLQPMFALAAFPVLAWLPRLPFSLVSCCLLPLGLGRAGGQEMLPLARAGGLWQGTLGVSWHWPGQGRCGGTHGGGGSIVERLWRGDTQGVLLHRVTKHLKHKKQR